MSGATLAEQFERLRVRDGLPEDATLHDLLAVARRDGETAGATYAHARRARADAVAQGEGYCCPHCEAGDRIGALAMLVDEHAAALAADKVYGPHKPETVDGLADGLRMLAERAMRKDTLGPVIMRTVLGIEPGEE